MFAVQGWGFSSWSQAWSNFLVRKLCPHIVDVLRGAGYWMSTPTDKFITERLRANLSEVETLVVLQMTLVFFKKWGGKTFFEVWVFLPAILNLTTRKIGRTCWMTSLHPKASFITWSYIRKILICKSELSMIFLLIRIRFTGKFGFSFIFSQST